MQKVANIIQRNSSISSRRVDKLTSGRCERDEIIRSHKKCSKEKGI